MGQQNEGRRVLAVDALILITFWRTRVIEVFNSIKEEGLQSNRHPFYQTLEEDEGIISYNQLNEIIDFERHLSDDQHSSVLDFLFARNNWNHLKMIILFGGRFDQEKRLKIKDAIRKTRSIIYQDLEAIEALSFEKPQIFEKLDPVTEFLATEYAKLLPKGSRKRLIEDLEALEKEGHNKEELTTEFLSMAQMEKIGQFLSYRADLVPQSYRLAFKEFQRDIAPGSFHEAKETIEAELGKPLDEVFEFISRNPIHAGTVGDAYTGILRSTKEKVVIKVVLPSRKKSIIQMLNRLQRIVTSLEHQLHRFQRRARSVCAAEENSVYP